MAVTTTTFPAALLAVALSYTLYRLFARPKSPAPLPPGPTPLPVLGNLADLTVKRPWLLAEKWASKYGHITYLHVLGQGVVFLNTPEAVFALLDKRGAIYSDKPRLVMAGELCGCGNMVAFTPYGDQLRRQRRLFQDALGPSSIKRYHPLLELETKPFLRGLLEDPLRLQDHLRRYAGGLTLSVVYGYQVVSTNDAFLTIADECMSLLSNRIAPAGTLWLVDLFPWLKYLPGWCPGTEFKRNAAVWKRKIEQCVDEPYAFVVNERRKGTANTSFVSTILDKEGSKDGERDEQRDFDLKWVANSMYAASIETTVTSIAHFVLAMVLHPALLKRAQAEIDAVVGRDRMPNFEDRPSLPYCDAVFSESLRWGAPVPLNLPHRLMADDVYEGVLLPQGSLVFANIWSILRDEQLFPDPHAFDPERYLESVDEATQRRRDPRSYVFGFGRRRCPGVHLVESSAWLLVVSMLATLDFGKAVDEHGVAIEPEVVFDNPVFRTPSAFKLAVRPRSEAALRLLAHGAGDA